MFRSIPSVLRYRSFAARRSKATIAVKQSANNIKRHLKVWAIRATPMIATKTTPTIIAIKRKLLRYRCHQFIIGLSLHPGALLR